MQTHKFSDKPYDFVLYGMTMSESKVSKTFIIRSPFIIMNQTKKSYMLKIETATMDGAQAKTHSLAPGEGYPLSPEELRGKIRFATLDDYYEFS